MLGDRRAAYRQFTTGVALITTASSLGRNVMAAEWTFHVSYDPFLIAVHVGPKATAQAIRETEEFGVNLVSEDQVDAMAFAGHFSRHDVGKLSSELFTTYDGEVIQAPLIRGCLLNAECKLVQEVPMGDHTAFVGEVVAFSVDDTKRPVILHRGSRQLGDRIQRDPAVAVAGVALEGPQGPYLSVLGELMIPDRAFERLQVEVLDSDGQRVWSGDEKADGRGRFTREIPLSSANASGTYTIVVSHDQATGRALVLVP